MANESLGLKYKISNKVVYLSGKVDEFSDFTPLLTMGFPLKLNLREIASINSIGIRRWIQFVKDLGVGSVEFYDCPPIFIDAANMIPELVSDRGHYKRVKSVLIPYQCGRCHHSFSLSVYIDSLPQKAEDIELEKASCPQCKATASTLVDEQEHFFFLESA